MVENEKPTVIDLFCGCGGFSLGIEKAGFQTVAAIDFNPEAIEVYRANFPHVSHVLCRDLTEFKPEYLSVITKLEKVDVIIGGPPCQGFSNLRKRDGSNHGPRLIEDNRRYLYKEYLKFVEYFNPYIFVIENVLGIKTAACGEYYKRVQYEARKIGYRVHGITVNANDFGVPQKRRRQLIIGTRQDLPVYFNKRKHLDDFIIKDRAINLGMAICDLPKLEAGAGEEIADYDMQSREECINNYGSWYLYDVLDVKNSPKLTAHVARPHGARDLEDFALIREGENCSDVIKRGENFLSPYKRTYFKDRYTRQSRERLCSTIVAHLSKDGLMFIHPTQNRSLTPREAARIQSFPDTFLIPVPRTHQYRLIGNAVPPLVGKAIGNAIKKYISDIIALNITNNPYDIPVNPIEAADRLWMLVEDVKNNKPLKTIPSDTFKLCWYSIGYLYPRLHPDGIIESNGYGKLYDDCLDVDPQVKDLYKDLAYPYYVQSGCPVALVPIIKEANRRHNTNELTDDEFYCSYSLLTGINYRLKTSEVNGYQSNIDDKNVTLNYCNGIGEES